MKEAELRQHCKCNLCGKGIGASGLPLFWRVKVERFGIDMRAVQRQDGLGVLLGSAVLANVMGPGEDLAQPIGEATLLTVCETCGTGRDLPVAALAEAAKQ